MSGTSLSPDVLCVLLQSNSLSLSSPDNMPDIADQIVLESTGSRILGDDEKYLAKMNRAGLPVLKRIETWALTAVDGKPFQKALDWVKDKQDWHFEAEL